MDKQVIKMKTLGAIFLFSLFAFGCGSAGTTPAGDGSPTLGITSVQKTAPAPKPNLALNLMNKGLGFLFGRPALAQGAPPCDPTLFAHKIPMTDGTIWVSQAYIIIDEIEFNFLPDILGISKEVGPFAFDLTNNVDDPFMVPETNAHENIIPDDYHTFKAKVGRFDPTPGAGPKNLTPANLSAFMAEVFAALGGGNDDRRPSIWIKGVTKRSGSSICVNFKFVSDREEAKIFQFFRPSGTINPGNLDVVFFLDIVKAFEKMDTDSGGTFVEKFEGEIGLGGFGPGFIDGRTDFALGSLNARLLSMELFNRFDVFTQPSGSFDGELAFAPDPA